MVIFWRSILTHAIHTWRIIPFSKWLITMVSNVWYIYLHFGWFLHCHFYLNGIWYLVSYIEGETRQRAFKKGNCYLDLLEMLGKSKKYHPKWWFNGDLPWYKITHHLKQKVRLLQREDSKMLYAWNPIVQSLGYFVATLPLLPLLSFCKMEDWKASRFIFGQAKKQHQDGKKTMNTAWKKQFIWFICVIVSKPIKYQSAKRNILLEDIPNNHLRC